ncbi:hypothetical protein P691DRAFT_761215 [Macrolepiota fuliginosa MF-IS2]|uniref:Uncharacterized protein n=1 Tax=Macrolepiota fuliginosa MF-IS2 TaxID=1400762 RepID=A0A9P6C2X3_9AGAR|nr:hypothetical protein P691DRAFT_761215 [Macrolepiota fuliginosa MF-IS2]
MTSTFLCEISNIRSPYTVVDVLSSLHVVSRNSIFDGHRDDIDRLLDQYTKSIFVASYINRIIFDGFERYTLGLVPQLTVVKFALQDLGPQKVSADASMYEQVSGAIKKILLNITITTGTATIALAGIEPLVMEIDDKLVLALKELEVVMNGILVWIARDVSPDLRTTLGMLGFDKTLTVLGMPVPTRA